MSTGRHCLRALRIVLTVGATLVMAAEEDDPALPLPSEIRLLYRWIPFQSGWRWDLLAADGRPTGVLRLQCGSGCFLAVQVAPSSQVNYDPGAGALRLAERGMGPRVARFTLHRAGWLLGDYGLRLGEVFRLGTAQGGAHPASSWRIGPFSARMRPSPALRGLAWERHGLGVYLSQRRLDVYQYRLRYRADAWTVDVLGPCEDPGRSRSGYRCEGDGEWYGRRIVDENGDELQGAVLPAVAEESLAAWVWRGRRGGVAAYLGRLRWLLGAPGMAMSAETGYPRQGGFAAWGGWWRWSWGRLSWVRGGHGTAWVTEGRGQAGRWRAWRYGAGYTNPYAAGPLARPWDRRRDHQGVRWEHPQGRWRLQAWSQTDGSRPGLALRRQWQGQGGWARLRLARRWGNTEYWGYRRAEMRLSGVRRTRWGRLQSTAASTVQRQEGVTALRLRLEGRWGMSWGKRGVSVGFVGFLRNQEGKRYLSVGDGDRVRLSLRGRHWRLGVWVGRGGRRALWWSWWGQSQSKP